MRNTAFIFVTEEEKEYLARRYWDIPDWQVETSVVLADKNSRERRNVGVE
jgi:hypothetical protein